MSGSVSPGRCTIGSLGVENINPHEELRRLDEQIKSATSLAISTYSSQERKSSSN